MQNKTQPIDVFTSKEQAIIAFYLYKDLTISDYITFIGNIGNSINAIFLFKISTNSVAIYLKIETTVEKLIKKLQHYNNRQGKTINSSSNYTCLKKVLLNVYHTIPHSYIKEQI